MANQVTIADTVIPLFDLDHEDYILTQIDFGIRAADGLGFEAIRHAQLQTFHSLAHLMTPEGKRRRLRSIEVVYQTQLLIVKSLGNQGIFNVRVHQVAANSGDVEMKAEDDPEDDDEVHIKIEVQRD